MASKKETPKFVVNVKINNLLNSGRHEISTKQELKQFPIGSNISYKTKKGNFRPGGFITQLNDESFIYITTDFSHKVRVKYTIIDKMWVGDVYKVKNDTVSIVKSTKNKTNFPVIIDNIPVYYAKNNFDKTRFMCTDKYKMIMQWREFFSDDK